jgi:tryptophanyl-tRNA synthetase
MLRAAAQVLSPRCLVQRGSVCARVSAPAKAKPVTKRIVSGIQPTGVPTIGNLLGALRNWVQLQNESIPAAGAADGTPVLFFIADYHSLTSAALQPAARAEFIKQLAALLMATGVDLSRATLFQQSHVRVWMRLATRTASTSCLLSHAGLGRCWSTASWRGRSAALCTWARLVA